MRCVHHLSYHRAAGGCIFGKRRTDAESFTSRLPRGPLSKGDHCGGGGETSLVGLAPDGRTRTPDAASEEATQRRTFKVARGGGRSMHEGITELASIGSRRRERFNFRASRKPKNDLAVFALNRIENDLKIGSSPSYTVIAASF